MGVEILFAGKSRFITANQQQMLTLLVSTYEAAVHRNTELIQAQDELRSLNERLEDLVEARTAALSAEIAERKQAKEEIASLAKFPSESPDPVLRIERDGTLLYANEASYTLLRDWQLDISKPAPPVLREVVSETLAARTGKTIDTEHGQRIISFFVAPVVGTDYANLYGRDVTDRRQAEAALRALAARQEALLAAIPDIIMEVDNNRVYTWANQAGIEFFGEDVIGKEAAFYFEGEQDTYAVVQPLFNGDESTIYVESWQRRKDGQKRLLAWWCQVLKDDHGNAIGALSSARDITESKRVEVALRESEERFRSLYENSTVGLYRTTPDGRILLANPTLVRILGYSSFDELATRDLEKHGFEPSYDRAQFLERIERDSEVKGLESSWTRRDGTAIFVRESARAIRDPQGKTLHYDGTVEDITARKRAEDEIRRLNAELEQRVRERTAQLEAANKELEAFSYSVSHDLRAPLRGIDGWSLALLEDYYDQLDEQARQYLDYVRSEAQRMGRLIDDLLQLSRVTRAEMQTSAVDLTALAQTVAARLRATQPERQVEMVIQPGLTAHGDAALLEIVLTNLLGNAWKFGGTRCPARIEFGCLPHPTPPLLSGEGREGVIYFVRDNGVGFDMAYAQKLFGAFQRMHRASEFPGTGIGLATVQRIIHRHGGQVWAEAQVDQGATFYFTLEEAP
jgi:PAS domain S-box-containing protein